METRFGFPLVTAKTIYQVLGELGVREWETVRPPLSIQEYLAGNAGPLTPDQLHELKFAPRVEVQFLKNPAGRIERYFRHVGRNWATTFVLLPGDLLIVVGEWKQGSNDITLVPPSGVPSNDDMKTTDPYGACARREFTHETGIELAEVISLSNGVGIPVSTRQSTQRCFPFLGTPKEPIVRRRAKLDETEFLKGVAIPLGEWLKLIEEGKVREDCSISTTFLALQKLGRLRLQFTPECTS
ncbi:hypothetical protein C4571_01290 [Candidatus Parcubacteria bacterium]|nr:MAG: hypothetical protein C4571_01290 [Candidatus Parcubacteria bacterium]